MATLHSNTSLDSKALEFKVKRLNFGVHESSESETENLKLLNEYQSDSQKIIS